MPDEVYKIFKDEYLNKCAPVDIPEAHYVQNRTALSAPLLRRL